MPGLATSRVLGLTALGSLLCTAACQETALPLAPTGEPRFTEVVIDSRTIEPAREATLSPGTYDFSVTSGYQVGPEDSGGDLVIRLYIQTERDEADGSETFLSVRRYAELPINDLEGTVSFSGQFDIPSCDGATDLEVWTEMFALGGASDGSDKYLTSGFHEYTITGASTDPCTFGASRAEGSIEAPSTRSRVQEVR